MLEPKRLPRHGHNASPFRPLHVFVVCHPLHSVTVRFCAVFYDRIVVFSFLLVFFPPRAIVVRCLSSIINMFFPDILGSFFLCSCVKNMQRRQ